MTTASSLVGVDSTPTNPLEVWYPVALLLPNWGTPVTVRTSYRTAIFTGGDGAETRRGQQSAPSRLISAELQGFGKTEARLSEILMSRLSRAGTLFPLWPDQTILQTDALSTDTVLSVSSTATRRFVVGGRVAVVPNTYGRIVLDNFVLGEISAVGANSVTLTAALGEAVGSGALVVPVLECETEFKRDYEWKTDRLVTSGVEMIEIPGKGALDGAAGEESWPSGLQTIGGIPVWPWYSNDDGSHAVEIEYPGTRTDLGFGRVYDDLSGLESRQFSFVRHFADRADWWEFQQLFDACRGSVHPFWFLSPGDDLTATDITNDTITFEAVGPESAWDDVDYVGVELDNGTHEIHEVIGSVRVGSEDIITVDTNWTAVLADVRRAGEAFLCRFSQDDITEAWRTTEHVTVEASLRQLRSEADVAVTVPSVFVGPVGVASSQEASGCAGLSAGSFLGYSEDSLVALYSPRYKDGVDNILQVDKVFNLAPDDTKVSGDLLWDNTNSGDPTRKVEGNWLRIDSGKFLSGSQALTLTDEWTAVCACHIYSQSELGFANNGYPFAIGSSTGAYIHQAIFRDDSVVDKKVQYRVNTEELITSPAFDSAQPLILVTRHSAALGTADVWLNGTKIGSNAVAGGSLNASVLGTAAPANNPYRGLVGDLALYTRALSDAEIADLNSNLMSVFQALEISGVTAS